MATDREEIMHCFKTKMYVAKLNVVLITDGKYRLDKRSVLAEKNNIECYTIYCNSRLI